MEILGIAIFASTVLYLAVTHKGFRKVVIWVGAACLLCAMAGGFYLWHRNRAEAKAKAAAQAADDAIQNARITRADAYLPAPIPIASGRGNDPYAKFGGGEIQPSLTPGYKLDNPTKAPPPWVEAARNRADWFAQHAPKSHSRDESNVDISAGLVPSFGNAALDEYDGASLFSCDAQHVGGDILAQVANGERVKVLRFGYEWGTDGNYGAKIQLANGLTGCILDGSYLKLDGE